MNNFVFSGNTSNKVMIDGDYYFIDKIPFEPNFRVDLNKITLNDDYITCASENTSNHSFRSLVSTIGNLDSQILEWAGKMLDLRDYCDLCGKFEMIFPLAKYDIEEFPELENKKVCQICRCKKYIDVINNIEEETRVENKKEAIAKRAEGFKYKYSFWVHPSRGDDFESIVYTSKTLTKGKLNKEIKDLTIEYNALCVEYIIHEIDEIVGR